MNTFKPMLYKRAKKFGFKVAQRLKRRNTIFDKLKREPTMQLTNMHDIAGFRLIFENEQKLIECRSNMHKSRAKSKLRTRHDNPYDYISRPKETGYRGIHDVYQYAGSSAQGEKWNGLLLEIQYRTIYQHAWATAVEVTDLITTKRIKFDQSDADHKKFFKFASEIIARTKEDKHSCYAGRTPQELVDGFMALDRKLGLLETLSRLKETDQTTKLDKHTLLIFHLDSETETEKLTSESFESINSAITRYEELEKTHADKADIVLVRADSPETVRLAFKNYFNDTREFVSLVKNGLTELQQTS